MPKHTFRKTDNGYLLQTGESPRNFERMLYVVWRGPIDNLQEEIISLKEMMINRHVRPEAVPAEWYNAFAAVTDLFEEREPEPAREPEPRAEPFVRPYAVGDLIEDNEREERLNPTYPLLCAWYWVLIIVIMIVCLAIGAS